MFKMSLHDIGYGQKKGWESNWQFDSRPLKVENRPDFLACMWLHTSSQSKVCTQSYGPPKSRKSQLWKFRDSHLGVSGQNNIWVLVPWPCTYYITRGKVVAFPKSRSWWVLWVRVTRGSFMHQSVLTTH